MICSVFSDFKMKNAEKKLLVLLLLKAFTVLCVYLYYDNMLAVGTTFKSRAVTAHDRLTHYQPFTESADQGSANEVQSKCSNFRSPSSDMTSQTWIPLTDRNNTYIYSAYYVKSGTEYKVVIIGAHRGWEHGEQFVCQLWYLNDRTRIIGSMVEEPSSVSKLPEGHGLRYSARLFTCPLSSDKVPSYVSIVEKSCNTPKSLLPVQVNNKPEVSNRKFTMCLSPLHSKFSDAHQIIEYIELNVILGADKFVIYNYSMAENVAEVLKYYSRKGIVEVHEWKPPIVDEIHYFGQVMVLNDCLYRNKNKSEYIVCTDLDEFIIPHSDQTNNWSDMVEQVNDTGDVYLFRNTFFGTNWNNEDTGTHNSLIDKYKLRTLRTFYHQKKIYGAAIRSKYIARTATVSQVMIHEVRGGGLKTGVVPIDNAYLHHYRHLDSDEENVPKVLDKTIRNKFEKELINNVQKVWTELKR
ncbi:hypothetical protein ACF0H5_005779 [Mactra antiquata]